MKIKNPLSEFIQHGTATPEQLDKVVKEWLIPINEIAHSVPLRVHSCFRSKKHEERKRRYTDDYAEENVLKSTGRKHWSQHVFETGRDPYGRGAIDVSADNMLALVELIISHIKPSRIARYNAFVHVDFAFPDRGLRYFNSSWQQITEKEFMETL